MTRSKTLAIIAMATFGSNTAAIGDPVTAKGDKATYDFVLSKRNDWQQMKIQARGFLWKHWQEKRRATLLVTMYTKEGGSTKTAFVIEPDNKNRWHVRISQELPFYNGILTVTKRESIAFKMHRIDPKDAAKGSDAYTLVLEGSGGQTLAKW